MVQVRFDRVVTELFSVQQKGQTAYKVQNRRVGELEQKNAQLMRRLEEMDAEVQKNTHHVCRTQGLERLLTCAVAQEAGQTQSADPTQSVANKFRVGGLRVCL